MALKWIKPNILSDRFEESDWILLFGTDKREVQLSSQHR